MLPCKEFHPPLLACPHGTSFQSCFCTEEDCFLHPYHSPPTWQGYTQYDHIVDGVLVHRWRDGWPIFQLLDNIFETGRQLGLTQARQQLEAGDDEMFAGVDTYTQYQDHLLPFSHQPEHPTPTDPHPPSQSRLNPVAQPFRPYASDASTATITHEYRD